MVGVIVGLSIVVVAALAALGFVLLRSDDSSTAATDAAFDVELPIEEQEPEPLPEPLPEPEPEPLPQPDPEPLPRASPIDDLESGLFCRDLQARGLSYAEAMAYWESEGRPTRMDASNNGIPCQTVYPGSQVEAYWGPVPGSSALPSGLFCRDLNARGLSYAQAVAYWVSEGRPTRMDASNNGIPCQTVYPRSQVEAYWGPVPGSSALPSGLFCRDLNARGLSYAQAVAYWLAEGQPTRMDASNNGIPCQTVYPRSQVEAYWGPVS